MGPWASSLRPSVRIKSSPKCSGMELQDLHLGPVRPHRVLLRGAGCPSRIPKVHLLGDAGRIDPLGTVVLRTWPEGADCQASLVNSVLPFPHLEGEDADFVRIQ